MWGMSRYKFIGGPADGEVHKVDDCLNSIEYDSYPHVDCSAGEQIPNLEVVSTVYFKRMIRCENDRHEHEEVSFFVTREAVNLSTAGLIKYILSNYRKENKR
jgi:hypothetical protein